MQISSTNYWKFIIDNPSNWVVFLFIQMKQLLAIKVQSLTDLITNSSSELFQLRTDQTVEQVSETLAKITSGYCKPVLFNLEEYRKNKNKLQEMLNAITPDSDASDEEWSKYWSEEQRLKEANPSYFVMDTVKGWFFDPEDPKDVRDVYEAYLCNYYDWDREGDNELQKEFKKFVDDNNYVKNNEGWRPYSPWNIEAEAFDRFIDAHKMPDPRECGRDVYHYGSIEELDGCILVLSCNDNSIPYETWDTINDLFNGTNYHLG